MRDLAPGAVFAGHRVEGVAGRGGMGVVYRARHLALDHVVALKVISPALAGDETFRRRFVSESRTAVSIRHPNVVQIHHAGEEEGLLFVTMDFVEGMDLRRLLNERGRLESERAVRILSEVATALDAAHARGLVHRDVKPGNVLLEGGEGDGRERVYLTDFGLTKRIESDSGLTATGAFVGTIDYIAPEQIRGERLDARTDVYALGCVLFEMLSGGPPFAARDEKVAKIYAHLQDSPPLLSETVAGVPAPLDDVVRRALEKQPDERYPSAGDLARAAAAAVHGAAEPSDEGSVATGDAAPALAAGAAATPGRAATAGDAATTAGAVTEEQPPDGLGEMLEGEPASAETVASGPGSTETVAAEPPSVAEPPAAGPPSVAEPPESPPGTGDPAGVSDKPGSSASRSRRHLSPPVALAGVGAVVAVVVTAVLIAGGDGERPATPASEAVAQQRGGGGAAGGERGSASRAKLAGAPIEVAGMPVGIAASENAVWVGSRTGELVRIDPDAGEVATAISGLGAPEGVAAGPQSIYAALSDEDAVARIDPGDESISRIPVGDFPRGVVHAQGAVWVTNGVSGTVSRIDPSSGEVVATVGGVGASPHGVAVGEGAVWVSNRDGGSVSRIDPGRNDVAATISVGANPKGIAVASGTVWVANTDDGTVSRIDPAENAARDQPIDVGGQPRGLIAAFGSVWVANGEGYVTRIDPRSGEVLQRLRTGSSPEELAAGPDAVWVTGGTGENVFRIEP